MQSLGSEDAKKRHGREHRRDRIVGSSSLQHQDLKQFLIEEVSKQCLQLTNHICESYHQKSQYRHIFDQLSQWAKIGI